MTTGTGLEGSASSRASDASARPVDVQVVIVNWNTRDDLRRCLASVLAQTRDVSFRIVVVDNASHDGSPQMVRSEFPAVRLIANTVNVGFAAGNNLALSDLSSRYVLLLNPDTVLLDGAIQNCVRFADADPTIGVLGCQVMEGDGTIQRTCFRFPSPLGLLSTNLGLDPLLSRLCRFRKSSMDCWDRQSQRDVDVVSGMFMLVRSNAIEQVGPMDPAYFIYAEEADWCYRFWRAGWRCVFAPVGKVMHTDGGGKSTLQVRTPMYVQLQKSLLIFHRKNRGFGSWLAAKAIYIGSMLLRTCLLTPVGLLAPRGATAQRAALARAALLFHVFGTAPKR